MLPLSWPPRVGCELGVALAVAGLVEAADRHVPLVGELAGVVAVDAAQVAGAGAARGEADVAFGRVGALALHEVDRDARLARTVDRARAAAQHFDAVDGVVDAKQRRALDERQRRRRVDRRAVHLDRGVRRVAGLGEAAHADVRAGLATGGLDEHAGDDLEQVGRVGRRRVLDLLGVGGGDRIARLLLQDALAARIAGDDDLLGLRQVLLVLGPVGARVARGCRGGRRGRGCLRHDALGRQGGRQRGDCEHQGARCRSCSGHGLSSHRELSLPSPPGIGVDGSVAVHRVGSRLVSAGPGAFGRAVPGSNVGIEIDGRILFLNPAHKLRFETHASLKRMKHGAVTRARRRGAATRCRRPRTRAGGARAVAA